MAMSDHPQDGHTDTLAADRLVETLVGFGVQHVFTCPGSTEAAFLHAAAATRDLEIILTTHESIAVAMADGFGRVTQRPAVAYLHANVGLTNGLSHLYAAQLAQSPVVVLTGLKETQIQSRGGFTTSTHMRDFARQYCKWDWQNLRTFDITYDVSRAVQVAATAPRGPSWVGLPQDLIESGGAPPPPNATRFAIDAENRAPAGSVSAVARLLATARRPTIVAGADVARSGTHARANLIQFAESLNAPVFADDRRSFERTVLPSQHPHYAGLYDVRRPSVADSDLLLFIGARCFTEFEAPTQESIPPTAATVHVHSDPAQVARIHGVDVAIVADSGAFLEDIVDHMGTVPSADPMHLVKAREEQQQIRADALRPRSTTSATSVAEVMGVLASEMDDETIVVGDATTSSMALLHAIEGTSATLHTTTSGSLGWGVGAAMGIKLADPAKNVIAVCGDGAFQFGLQGLWTAARYRVPVTYLVVNNAAYAAVGAAIKRYAGKVSSRERELAVDLAGPSLADVAAGFGVRAVRATSMAHLAAALEESRSLREALVIEIMTDPLDLGP